MGRSRKIEGRRFGIGRAGGCKKARDIAEKRCSWFVHVVIKKVRDDVKKQRYGGVEFPGSLE